MGSRQKAGRNSARGNEQRPRKQGLSGDLQRYKSAGKSLDTLDWSGKSFDQSRKDRQAIMKKSLLILITVSFALLFWLLVHLGERPHMKRDATAMAASTIGKYLMAYALDHEGRFPGTLSELLINDRYGMAADFLNDVEVLEYNGSHNDMPGDAVLLKMRLRSRPGVEAVLSANGSARAVKAN
jgi:hypothetical protein